MNALRIVVLLHVLVSSAVYAQYLPTFPAANSAVGEELPGIDLGRHWIVAPDTFCNDGSTPVAYVRRAQNQANLNNWIIYLEGGSSCKNGEDCLNRWQSFQTNYGIQKMSTSISQALWAAWHPGGPAPSGWPLQAGNYQVPPGITGFGIMSSQAINPFSDWNKVYLNYCSSDIHIGRMTDSFTQGTDNSVSPPQVVNYFIHFHGDKIFANLINDLRAGVNYCIDRECEELPTLNDAKFVLLSGSSAGGAGVKHQLDRFRADQRSINKLTEVRGVIDTSAPMGAELPFPVPPAPFTSFDDLTKDIWDNTFLTFWDAHPDDSCTLENTGDVAWRCADSIHVMRHHITTPYFHRADLQDQSAYDPYQSLFFPSPAYPPTVAALELAERTQAQLRKLGNIEQRFLPRYPNELNTVAADPQWIGPGIFGPRCTNHVGLIGNITFFNQELPDSAGIPTSFSDALMQWVTTVPGGIAGPGGPVLIENVGIGSMGFPRCQ